MSKTAAPQIDLDIVSILFLSVLSHFLPPWGDYLILVGCLIWNTSIAMKFKGNVPAWFVLLVIVQVMMLVSGFNTDHDPFDGEWGGKSEPSEWF